MTARGAEPIGAPVWFAPLRSPSWLVSRVRDDAVRVVFCAEAWRQDVGGSGRDLRLGLPLYLAEAARYVLCLVGAAAPRGMVAFTALPLLLARATIERVAEGGAGSKVTRSEVGQIVAGLEDALERGNLPQLFAWKGALR